ncbi:MAG: hypothetical protein GX760_03300 [Erysipelothrix sp.]|nr:hypothetical protein [Erysipelothrix sp.]
MHKEAILTSSLESNALTLSDNGVYTYTFDQSGVLFLNLKDAKDLTINMQVAPYVDARLIFWNESKHKIRIVENYECLNDSRLNIIYGELSDGDLDRTSTVNLRQGSSLLVEGASVTASTKKQVIVANHLEINTTSDLNNYGIVSENGHFTLDVVGKIFEDARGAKAHQDSKVLTLSPNQHTLVTPKLLIYENDVEASHAATVGQVDELQLYYMQSRGLSKMEATALLMSGYLLPIARAIEDEELRVHVQELIAVKVDEICSIAK